MTAWNGFTAGIIVGAIITLVATDKIAIFVYTQTVQNYAYTALFVVFVSTQAITAYQMKKHCSLLSPTLDGFIVGIGFIEAVVVFLLYGFKL
jgi:hypothetical protein